MAYSVGFSLTLSLRADRPVSGKLPPRTPLSTALLMVSRPHTLDATRESSDRRSDIGGVVPAA